MLDQAEKLRLMVRRSGKRAQVLAVTSGKGGVGKSNIAANLAICLVAAGKNVVLVDADLGLANLDIILNLQPRYTLADVLDGNKSLKAIMQRGPAGLKVICGASGLAKLADLSEFQRQRVLQELNSLEHQADIIVIDTGAGISRDVMCFTESADHTIVITTPEPPAITDAYAMIKTLVQSHSGVNISLLVNMTQSRAEAKKIYQRLSSVSGKFLAAPLHNGGYILKDDHICQAVLQREPVVIAYPRSQATHCFVALAGKVARVANTSVAQDGFFKKVVNWFF